MQNHVNQVLLIGAGYMAKEYCKVLLAQQIPFQVMGRSKETAAKFIQETGVAVWTHGLSEWFEQSSELPCAAIVAIDVVQLAPVTLDLIHRGVKKILVEKPGGLSITELRKVMAAAKQYNAKVFIAYNRRFYASTLKAMEIITQDGGLSSFHFEFTEWNDKIEKLDQSILLKQNWFIANSTHVIDLAFYLGGKPKVLQSFTMGGLSWHPSASVFAGSGRSEQQALFTYLANWEAPGRWAVELLTKKHRLYLKPLEQLFVQKKGSLMIHKVDLDDTLDQRFKPGLFHQVEAFLETKPYQGLVSLEEQIECMKGIYLPMLSGDKVE